MDHGPLRALALEVNLQVHGVPVTITPPGEAAIEARGIWLRPDIYAPGGTDAGHRSPLRVLALRRSDIATVLERTEILAPELAGDTAVLWVVDSVDRQDADHVRVTVIRRP